MPNLRDLEGDPAQGSEVDLGVEPGSVGAAMAEMVPDLLHAPASFEQVLRTGMAQAVRAAPRPSGSPSEGGARRLCRGRPPRVGDVAHAASERGPGCRSPVYRAAGSARWRCPRRAPTERSAAVRSSSERREGVRSTNRGHQDAVAGPRPSADHRRRAEAGWRGRSAGGSPPAVAASRRPTSSQLGPRAGRRVGYRRGNRTASASPCRTHPRTSQYANQARSILAQACNELRLRARPWHEVAIDVRRRDLAKGDAALIEVLQKSDLPCRRGAGRLR